VTGLHAVLKDCFADLSAEVNRRLTKVEVEHRRKGCVSARRRGHNGVLPKRYVQLPYSYITRGLNIMHIIRFILSLFFLLLLQRETIHAQWQQTNEPYGRDVRTLAISGINLFAGTWGCCALAITSLCGICVN
jgi:hypothetical protein